MDFIDLKTQYQRIRESVNARIQKVLDQSPPEHNDFCEINSQIDDASD